MGTKKTTTTPRQFADGMNALHKLGRSKPACANCCAPLPGPYGTPGVAMARFDNKTLLCSLCGTLEALSNTHGTISVSKWFQDTIDSHSIYRHQDIAREFLEKTGQIADWPVATYKETEQNTQRPARRHAGTRIEDSLVCYGWIMARHMASKLVNHQSHMMGRGYEFRDCVAALAKGGK